MTATSKLPRLQMSRLNIFIGLFFFTYSNLQKNRNAQIMKSLCSSTPIINVVIIHSVSELLSVEMYYKRFSGAFNKEGFSL